MDEERDKPLWFWIYLGISIVMMLFGFLTFSSDTTGFAILSAGPLVILGILLFVATFAVYYFMRKDKKPIAKLIVWPLFLIPTAFFINSIVQTIIWIKEAAVNWFLLTFMFIIMVMFLILLIIVNKKD